MTLSPLAGKPAPPNLLIDLAALERAYFELKPDPNNPAQRVMFGTSGHRGSPFDGNFNQAHILAITQAICDFRKTRNFSGPLFMGKDTHAVSTPAEHTALQVLAANGVETVIQSAEGFTPTPAISRAILAWNRKHPRARADGIVITPSHNPPRDGGFKYNPPEGGPADSATTQWIQNRANELLRDGNASVKRVAYETARRAPTTHTQDYVVDYVDDLAHAIDFDATRASGIKIGVDPLGGAALAYWLPLAEKYGLNLTVTNPKLDATFAFMTVDHDGKIRMDCSSPYAMAGLVRLKDDFDIAWGNDPDADRHGIVTRSSGLMNPNHYLAVAIEYLLTHRPQWRATSGVGKTLVSSSMIDRVVGALNRKLVETPVGFKYLAPGLFDSSFCFGGEESAGASFLRRDGTVWTTDKDGPLLGLLAAEITAVTGRDPGEHYQSMTARFGAPYYTRQDAPANATQKAKLAKLAPTDVSATELAGEKILAKLTRAPGDNEPIGGLKVVTEHGWFAARPSGTEDIYKIYAESFISAQHLQAIVEQAQTIVARALAK
ncbi:MAG: phosphoglucomutase, alpha-D-glucose phosphate-specific [Chloroflexota bacterium]|nr:MAG: phosphoglucomutase, alpha-D-glucose phosphate-specific [Chloroflexota bacterium]